MTGRHTGKHLAQELEALLKSFGIEKKACISTHTVFVRNLPLPPPKILAIVCDNASNNDTMIEAIDLEGFRGPQSRVRCFPHIINLAVKV